MGMQVVKEMDGLRREMRRQERRITSMENERKQNEFIVEALKEEKRSLIIKLRRAVTGQDPILEIENTPPPPPPSPPPPPPPSLSFHHGIVALTSMQFFLFYAYVCLIFRLVITRDQTFHVMSISETGTKCSPGARRQRTFWSAATRDAES